MALAAEALPTHRDRADFFGGGGWVTSKIDPATIALSGFVLSAGAKGSDDPTQLDKPVEVGSVVQHLPDAAIAQRELNA